MSVAQLSYSVDQQRAWQRLSAHVGLAGLLGGALVFGGLLATGSLVVAVLLAVSSAVVLGPGLFWRRPDIALYVTLFCALFIEQFGIVGLDPITTQTHFFQSLSGFTPLQVPVMPADLVLIPGLLAIILPALARSKPFIRGALFAPVMLLVAAVVGSLVYGAIHQVPGTTFNPNAAWAEGRSFLQLAGAYVLATNIITNRARLIQVLWVFVAAVGLKGLQGIQNYVTEKQLHLGLEAITGHEDVLFFGTFFILFAAMKIYGGEKRQQKTMLLLMPTLALTELFTSRRNAFVILAVGFLLLGMSLWHVRRQLFFKILPPALVLVSVYTIAFWDHSEGALGQPIRAFKSQIGFTSARDQASDQWRVLENQNIELNIKGNPILGLGYGRPYTFYVAEPSLDATGFTYWDYITHDSIMWVWMKMGLYGFAIFWSLWGAAIVYGLVTFKQLTDGYLRAIAISVVALVMMQLVFSYTDLGLTYSRSMIFMGCMLGVLVRLRDMQVRPAAALDIPGP